MSDLKASLGGLGKTS